VWKGCHSAALGRTKIDNGGDKPLAVLQARLPTIGVLLIGVAVETEKVMGRVRGELDWFCVRSWQTNQLREKSDKRITTIVHPSREPSHVGASVGFNDPQTSLPCELL
jgi:hypothetical protein